MRNEGRSFFVSPRLLYLIVGGMAGLFFVVLTPPFQVADEFSHLARAYQISRGDIIASQDPKSGYPGGRIPRSWAQAYRATTAGMAFRPRRTTSLEKTRSAFGIEFRPHEESFVQFQSALYTPVPYLPQVLAAAAARLTDVPALAHLYLARLFALVAALALGWWTLTALPFFQWPMLLLMLMPMTLFQTASASADSFTNALSFALVACVLRGSMPDSRISRGEKARLIVLVVLVALSKQVYFLLAMLLFLLPERRFRDAKERWTFVSLGFLAALGAVVGWSLMIPNLLDAPRPGVVADAARQLDYIAADPIGFMRVLMHNYGVKIGQYYRQFIGVLGWLDTYLPNKIHALYGGFLVFMALADGDRGFALGPAKRATLIALTLAALIVIPMAAYVAFTPAGFDRVRGIQGRYFIPFAPVALLALHNRRFAGYLKPRVTAALVSLVLVVVWAATAQAFIQRYYGGIGRLTGWI